MQINNIHTFVNEWNFDEMSFMVDLRIDKTFLHLVRSAALYNLFALS